MSGYEKARLEDFLLDIDNMILRKGAVSARKDERIIIPMNMSDGSVIAIGKDNKDWNYSAPHGAGRVLSRTQAKKSIKLHDFQKSMVDVWTMSVSHRTLDESPFVYKSLDEILRNTKDTITVV